MRTQLRYLSLLAALFALAPGWTQAAEITVDADGICTLAEAIDSANDNNANGNGCVDGTEQGVDIIYLETDVLLAAALPLVTGSITIEGQGHTIDGNGGGWSVLTNDTTGALTVNEATITGGRSSFGGGIYNGGANVTLNNCTVIGNEATEKGGGIFNEYGFMVLINSTVSGNFVDGPSSSPVWGGGGLFIQGGTITLINSTVTRNGSTFYGGGIYLSNDGSVILNSSVVSGNMSISGRDGQEIYNKGGMVTADSNNVFGNSSENRSMAFEGFTPDAGDIDATSEGVGIPLTSILDPTLSDNGGPTKTHALVLGSPAIDLDAECSALLEAEDTLRDQRNFHRPIGAGCDAGAFEFGSSKMIVDADGVCTLADAITAANTDTATGGCPAGSGDDTIYLETDVLLDVALPEITSPITIEGQGYTVDGNDGDWSVLGIRTGNGDLTLNETVVTGANHTSGDGGGIMNYGGTLTLNNSRIEGNTAGNGGGIYNTGSLTLTKSSVNGNTTWHEDGGGIFNAGSGTVSLVNSTISGNSTPNSGGGISNWGGTVVVIHSTISGNSAGLVIGGIENFAGEVTLINSIVAGNTCGISACINEISNTGTFTANSFNLIGHSGESSDEAFDGFTLGSSDVTATSDGTNPTALSSILKTTLADNGGSTKTHALVPGSPAIDLDTGTTCSTGLNTDQRGEHRPFGSGCDAGAYELKAIFVDAEGDCTLGDAITSANTDTATGGCPAGFEHDTIILDTDVTLASELPEIRSQITIEGNNHIIDGNEGNGSVLTVSPEGDLTLNETIITGGMAFEGGGILNAGTTVLNNCTIRENWAGRSGGGIFNRGTLILTSSTIYGNGVEGVGAGGGLCTAHGGSVTLINCTVSENWARNYGGGIFNYGEDIVTLINSTVTGNSTAGEGGGIFYRNDMGGAIILHSSIVSGNIADGGGNEIFDWSGERVIADSFNLFGHSGENNAEAFEGVTPGDSNDRTATSDGTKPTELAAILSPLADNGGLTMTHALVPGSPAIDLDATCSTDLDTDQRGELRPVGAGCDAGSFEGSVSSNKAFLPAIYLLLLNN